jgi:hypothetical protein
MMARLAFPLRLSPARSAARRLIVLAVASSLAVALTATTAGRALADCDGPVPSFRDHAESAKRIVIGDVVAVDPSAPWTDDWGRSSRFTLRVRYALRGQAESVMALTDLAFLPCADHIIIAREGDRIAVALDATGFTPPISFTTVAWISGTPPDFAGIERITVSEAFALVGLDPPDTSTAREGSNDPFPWSALAAAIAGISAALAAWRRRSPERASSGLPRDESAGFRSVSGAMPRIRNR